MMNESQVGIVDAGVDDAIRYVKLRIMGTVFDELSRRNGSLYKCHKVLYSDKYIEYDDNLKCVGTTKEPLISGCLSCHLETIDLQDEEKINIELERLKDGIFENMFDNEECVQEQDNVDSKFYLWISDLEAFRKYNPLLQKEFCVFSLIAKWFLVE